MTVIKLGRNTYRVYNAGRAAVSVLVYIKNGQPIVKRVDSIHANDKGFRTFWSSFAIATMQQYLIKNAQAWEIQGEILAALV
jgi:hypothetical protein